MILEKTVVFQLEIIVVVKRVIHMMDVHGKEYEKKNWHLDHFYMYLLPAFRNSHISCNLK